MPLNKEINQSMKSKLQAFIHSNHANNFLKNITCMCLKALIQDDKHSSFGEVAVKLDLLKLMVHEIVHENQLTEERLIW